MASGIPENLPPAAIPDHRLVRRIGRGSYGEVWLAANSMGMYRAVKVVYRRSFDDKRPFDRELSGIRKFEPISRSHEGFVDILHVGFNGQDEYFYYIMELGDDVASGQEINPDHYSPKTLGHEITLHGKLPLQECIQLGLALSQALNELHKHGLVHRDIKPANIIFVHGVPKLADIGLVAGVDDARSYVGTEGFIPPEGPGSPQADIYSLGKVLYETSTGKDRHDFPELPTLVDEFADHEGFLELNEVILHACKNDLKQRYETAWDMYADLVVLANGKSVRRLKSLERRLSQFKRIAGITLLTLLVLAAASYQIYREWRNTRDARQRQVGKSVADGQNAVESGNLLWALPFFAEASRLEPSRESDHRFQFSSTLAQCLKLSQMWFEGSDVRNGAFSPDGSKILIPEPSGKIAIFDIASGAIESRPFELKSTSLCRASFSPDGALAVSANLGRSVYVWNTTDLVQLWRRDLPGPATAARFSPDGSRIATACADGFARIYNVKTGDIEKKFRVCQGRVLSIAFSHNGKMLVTSDEKNACLWDASTANPIGHPMQHSTWVNYSSFSPDDQMIVTACSDHNVRVWNVETQTRFFLGIGHRSDVESAEYSPDGYLIVTASYDGTIRLWLADGLQPLPSNSVIRHSAGVEYATFYRDGHRILTTCADGTVRIWDLAGAAVAPILVRDAFSKDGTRALALSSNIISVRDVASGRLISQSLPQDASIESARLNCNGHFVISILTPQSGNGTNRLLQLSDADTGKAISPPFAIPTPFGGASISDDGRRLAIFTGKTVQKIDPATGTAIGKPLKHSYPIASLFFNPDGKLLAAINGHQVDVWNADGDTAAYAPLKHPVEVSYAEFSPNGIWLATCCADQYLNRWYAQIWNATTGLAHGPQLMHGDGVCHVSFSSDSRRLVTAGEDFTAIVWDVMTGEQVTPVLHHAHQVRTAGFSPDAKWIVTASLDNSARIWSAETGDASTPPLWHANQLDRAQFLSGPRRIITTDSRNDTRIWDFPINTMPLDDLRKLAALLSGNTMNPQGSGTVSPQSQSLDSLWLELHQKYPVLFTTSAAEIDAWHSFQAEQCETASQWTAAIFHLNRLLLLHPGDPSLPARIAKANEHLPLGK